MARGSHEPGRHKPGRHQAAVSSRAGGPQAGNGRKATGQKPQRSEVVQRGAGGKILEALTRKLWGR
jgi:hypothetical protein